MSNRSACGACLLAWSAGLASCLAAETLRVPTPQYATLQRAIDFAADGDTVLVAPGTYLLTEPLRFNRLHDPARPESPPLRQVVVRSERGAEETILRMAAAPSDVERASVAIFDKGEDARTVLEGFTIRDGRGTTLAGFGVGGGIICFNRSSPTVRDCAIVRNFAGRFGGGLYCAVGSHPTFENCRFEDDFAPSGGAVYCDVSSDPSFIGCVFARNSAGEGGGLYCRSFSRPSFEACRLESNGAAGGGGAVFATVGAAPRFSDGYIIDRQDPFQPAVHCEYQSSMEIRRSTIILAGSPLAALLGSSIAVHCAAASSVTLSSCIVWGNVDAPSFAVDASSRFEASFCLIQGDRPWPGEGNILADPQFCGWDADDIEVGGQEELESALRYRFGTSRASPCRGAGSGGEDIGAPGDDCDVAGPRRRLLRLLPGDYHLGAHSLFQGVSLLGSGAERTMVLGPITGLQSGASISRLQVIAPGSPFGMIVPAGESPEIRRCRFSFAETGVVLGFGSRATFRACEFSHNTDALLAFAATARLENCLVVFQRGRGLVGQRGARLEIVHSVIADNQGHGIAADDAAGVAIENSIVYYNQGGALDLGGARGHQVHHSCVQVTPVAPGLDNTNRAPRFVARPALNHQRARTISIQGQLFVVPDPVLSPADYHLREDSTLIDAGEEIPAVSEDFDGRPRRCGAEVDIGAFERCPDAPAPRFRRGDCDGDGTVAGTVTDAVFHLAFNFAGGPAPRCLAACDADADGRAVGQVTDAVFLLAFNFLGGPPPPPPFPGCGEDPSAAALGCDSAAEDCR
jgi:hypothetical protein